MNKTEEGYITQFDLNYVAIVNKDEKIDLYNGNSINGVAPEEYAAVYEKYLKENFSKAIVVQQNTFENKFDEDIQLAEVVDNKDEKPVIYILIATIIVAIIISISLFVKKKKESI